MNSLNVLIVEDDFVIQMFIEKVVRDLGWNLVGVASRSEEALRLLETAQPDIVMMDIGIDGKLDGIETASEIKNRISSTNIVFVTGNADKVTMDRAKNIDPLGFIFKPIDEDKLKEELSGFRNELLLKQNKV